MKVLFIYDDFPLSSEDTVGCFVLEEATNLIKRNVELLVFKPLLGLGCIEVSGIEVVGLKGAQDLRGDILHRVSLMFKLFKSLPLLGKYIVKHPKGTYRLLKMAFLAAKIVRNKQVDVIHAHFAYPNGLIGAIAKQL